MKEQNPYLDTVKEYGAETLRNSMAQAVDKQPENEALVQTLAKQYNLPIEAVRLEKPTIERRAKLDGMDYKSIVENYKATALFLTDPNNAALAHDDTETLTALEALYGSWQAARGPEPSFSSTITGLASSIGTGAELTRQGIRQQTADALGFEDVSKDAQRKAGQARFQQELADPEFESSTAQGLYGGGRSLLQMVPGIAGAIITRNPSIAIGAAGVQTETEAYTRYRARGATPGEALTGAAGEGAVEVVTELLPMSFLVNRFGKEGAGKFLTEYFVKEGLTEQAATLAQDAIDTAIANPDKTWGDYIKERPDAAYQTALGTLVASGTLGAANAAARRLSGESERVAAAQHDAEVLTKMVEIARASPTAERSPAALKQFTDIVASSGVKDLYVNAQALAQSGIDVIGLAGISPSVEEQLQQALDTGGDIKIPLSEFVANIAPSDLGQPLVDHLKTSPEGMSGVEAQEFTKNQAAELQAQTEKVLAEKIDDEAFKASSRTVHEEILRQLNEANRFSPDVNESYATLHSNFATVYGAKLGVTPEEFYKQYYPRESLFVQAQSMTDGATSDLQQDDAPRDLLIQHNLTERNLLHAGRLGGIPVPSLAVTNKAAPLTNFGEITLLGSPEMADPRGYAGTKVFGADVYSPRYPTITYAIGNKELTRLNAELAPHIQRFGGGSIYTSGALGEGSRDLERNVAVVARFLEEKGVTAEPVLDENGRPDDRESLYELEKQVRELGLRDDLEKYAQKLFDSLGAQEKIFRGYTNSGNRRYIEHNLENVVKILKKELRGGEGFNYGVGSLRARFTPQFKSIKQIRDAKKRLVDGETFKKIKDEIDKEFSTVADSLKSFYAYDANKFGYYDDVINVFADAAKIGLPRALNEYGFKDVPTDAMRPVAEFLSKLRELPTEYFEAKILRDVSLSEFSGAVVPEGTSEEAVQYLRDRGIKDIKTYKSGDDADRAAKIAEFEHLFFQDTGNKRGSFNPATSTITLLAKADLSTFLHESGHFFLETLNRIALDPNAPAEVKQDMDATLKWMGIEADGKPVGGTKEGEFSQDSAEESPYHRFTKGDADTGIGYMMFADDITRVEGVYGENYYTFDPADLPAASLVSASSDKLRKAVAAALRDRPDITDDYRTTAEELAEQLDPSDIVDGAGIWDAPDIVEIIYNEVLEPNGWDAVLTSNGAIVFDRDVVKDGDPDVLNQSAEQPAPTDKLPSGRTRLEVWNAMSLEEQRVYHEKFARGFEAYLFEGRAPSLEIQRVFQRFRAWLMKVYRSLVALNVEINDDVRGVFDRMLASSEQIKEAEAARNFEPMFRTPEEAGMTPEEFKEYIDTGLGASVDAAHELEKRSLRDMKWLSNAKGKALKKLQAEADAKRRAVRQEITEQVMSEPVYRAREFLKRGMLDGDKVEGAHKLYIPEVEAMLEGNPALGAIKEKLGYGKYGMLGTEQGVHPDQVAEMFGLESGDQLIRELVAAEDPKAKIDALTDKTMLERYGDLTDEDAVERAAERAIHNEARLRFVATEMAALLKQMGSVQELQRLAKGAAESAIGQVKVKELNPNRYIAAGVRASRAAEKAIKSGDRNEAIRQKRLQLFHVAMTKAAMDARADSEKALLKFRKLFRKDKVLAKKHDMKLVTAARAVLGAYGIGGKVNAVQALSDLEKVKEYDPEMYAQIEPVMRSALQGAGDYASLPYADFKAMLDAVNQIVHSAKRSKQVRIDGQLISKKEVTAALRARMEEIGIPAAKPGDTSAVSDADRRKWTLQGLVSAARRVEAWVDSMDGGEFDGPFRKYIFQPISNAVTKYRTEKNRVLREYVALLREKQAEFNQAKVAAPEINYTFANKNELLGALLHIGNMSNKRKLLLGRGWATETVTPAGEKVLNTGRMDAFLDRMIKEGTLTKSDFDFLQKVWDLMESIKGDAQKAHYDMYGHYFSEITADPVVTPFGTYRGGYAPAVADKEIVQDATMKAEANAIEEGFNYMMPSTATGFTKGRVEYNKPLVMDLRLVASHIDQALRFTYVQPAVRDALRIIRSSSFAGSMQKMDPTAITEMLMPWLHRSARQLATSPWTGWGGKAADKFLKGLRKRTGMVAMTANLVNAFQQITGFTMAAVKVNPRHLKSSLFRYMKAPNDTAEAIAALSPWMAERLSAESFELRRAMDDILEDDTAWQKTKEIANRHAYFAQRAFQNVVDIVSWQAAFDQASATMTEKEAVQFADSVVRQTQGTQSPEDIARFEASNSFVQLFTQFTGYFNMQANLLGTEYKKTMRDMGGDKGRLAYVYAMGFMLPAVIADGIVRTFGWDWDDEDDDGYLDEMFAWFFGSQLRTGVAMFPFVGSVANAGVNAMNKQPFDDRLSTSPSVSTIESSVRAPVSVYKALAGEGRASKAIGDVLTLITMTTGIPVAAVSRPLKYAADAAQDKVEPANAADLVRGAVSGKGREEERKK